MSEQEFELYLKLLSRCLNLTAAQRDQIADELRDHLVERLEELASAGVPREKAVVQALDEFGDAAVLAGHFTSIARLKRRRLLMRLSLGSVAALAATMLLFLAFSPDDRVVQAPARVNGQDKSKPVAGPAKANTITATPGLISNSDALKTVTHERDKLKDALQQVKAEFWKVKEADRKRIAALARSGHPLSSDTNRYPLIEVALDSPVDFTIEPEPLKDALDFIHNRFEIPILLDTKALEEASIDPSTAEVKLNVPGIRLRDMLSLLFQQVPNPLGFEIRDGVLMITTIDKITSEMVVVVYDCRDLTAGPAREVDEHPDRSGNAKSTSDSKSRPEAANSGSSSQAAQTPAGASSPSQPPAIGAAGGAPKKNASARHPPVSPLIQVIQAATDKENWDGGEGSASISEFGGLLIVRTNPLVQEQVKAILADIRRMKKDGAFAGMERK